MARRRTRRRSLAPWSGQATERGFGTGLRAQLQRRQNPQAEEQTPEPAERPDPSPYVDYELSSPAAPEAGVEAAGEVEDLRAQLEEAQKRERELRVAFAEQVEAYERKLSVEHEVAHEQTKLEERSARLSGTESAIRQREERLAAERQELNAERKKLSALQDEVATAQAAAAELQEELQAREAELTEAERLAGRSSRSSPSATPGSRRGRRRSRRTSTTSLSARGRGRSASAI